MSSIHGHSEPPREDATNWRTLRSLVFLSGVAAAIFVAGMNYGHIQDNAANIALVQARAERTYVRKDGRELADMQAQLKTLNEQVRVLNEKIDYMIRNRP